MQHILQPPSEVLGVNLSLHPAVCSTASSPKG